MGGAGLDPPGSSSKIKGGRWTVVKFFFISTGFTCVWMALCSELGTFRKLYGPSVLLKMNIMYYTPSIPLLALSSYVDEPLDNHFGVAKTVLIRLLIGLGGCSIIALVFPFEPSHLSFLLVTVGALGSFHGISFSASYQLVSRFANKNTIALGLGCVGSGGIILAAEVALRMGTNPSTQDETTLYGVCACLVLTGMLAAVSLLLRHWRSVDAGYSVSRFAEEKAVLTAAQAPLLAQPDTAPADLEDVLLATGTENDSEEASPSSLENQGRRASSKAILALSPLDFFKSVSDGETTLLLDSRTFAPVSSRTPSGSSPSYGRPAGGSDDGLWHATVQAERGVRFAADRQASDPTSRGRPQQAAPRSLRASSQLAQPCATSASDNAAVSGASASRQGRSSQRTAELPPGGGGSSRGASPHKGPRTSPFAAANPLLQQLSAGSRGSGELRRPDSFSSVGSWASAASQQAQRASANAKDTMRRMWPIQAALFTSGTVGLLIFPFITYVPTSGALGELLPKWLFFVRLFADLTGRMIPRAKRLSLTSQISVLALAGVMAVLAPLFYLYIALAPPWMCSDALACGYIAVMWLLNGAVNTNAYVLAPKVVLPEQKATAAGILAVTYQGAHVAGLLAGTAICFVVFAGF